MSLTLTDQGGNQIPRFGAAGVKKALMAPVKPTSECKFNTYAMVWCEEAEIFLMRDGKGAHSYELTLIYWDSANEDALSIDEIFESKYQDKAITKFLKLCKRDPLYAPV